MDLSSSVICLPTAVAMLLPLFQARVPLLLPGANIDLQLGGIGHELLANPVQDREHRQADLLVERQERPRLQELGPVLPVRLVDKSVDALKESLLEELFTNLLPDGVGHIVRFAAVADVRDLEDDLEEASAELLFVEVERLPIGEGMNDWEVL